MLTIKPHASTFYWNGTKRLWVIAMLWNEKGEVVTSLSMPYIEHNLTYDDGFNFVSLFRSFAKVVKDLTGVEKVEIEGVDGPFLMYEYLVAEYAK